MASRTAASTTTANPNSAPQAGSKASPGKSKSAAATKKPVTLLAGGNPQIAKGDAQVSAWVKQAAALPGWSPSSK